MRGYNDPDVIQYLELIKIILCSHQYSYINCMYI